ncbi:uncharacterized protein [Dendrobates tinctorius]|uniref:uncharacterized protein n=1 Tax=Dendrobates tinctorius TaxID=92724 RepID=UPI003CC9DB6C
MDGWDSATASSKKAFSEYFPALYCAAVTVVLDGTVGFRARYILAGNPTVSSGSTVTALSIVLVYCAAVTVVLDGTVGFRARYILAGNPTVSSGSTVTALSIVLLYCAAVTVVLDGTVGFHARYILAGNPTVSSGSTVTALSILLLYCAAVTVVLDGTVFFFPTVDKVRTRWRSIKDRFNSDVRAEGQVRSGSASRTRTRYRHYHALQFLRPVLATRSTCSSTLQPGPRAVLPRTSSDPSQPSDSQEAPCRSATHTAGDQEAGPSGVPLSQVSATGYAGTTRQRQRALDRNVLPEFMHLSEAFNSSLKSLSDRVESGFALMERGFNHFEHRFNSVEQCLDRLEADLNRPAHHFFSKIEKGMAEHLSPEQQLNVLQACNNAFLQAMQHNRYGQQSVVSFPPVPPLTRFTSLPTCAAYHCTDTSIQSQDTHRYTTTSLSAAGHFTDTTMASAAPVWSTTATPMHAWSSATTRQTWNSPAATTTCSSPATTTPQTWTITAATSPPARTSTANQEQQQQPPQQQQQPPQQQQQPPQQQQQPPQQQQQQPPQQQHFIPLLLVFACENVKMQIFVDSY